MNAWYYVENGQQQGPVTKEQLQSRADRQLLRPDDLVWAEGMAAWQPARSVTGLAWPTNGGGSRPPEAVYSPTGKVVYDQRPQITNYLPWAIAATLLCCLPAGVVSIVYSAKASSAQTIGDFAAASQAAEKAKFWLILAVVLTFVPFLIMFLVGIVGAIQPTMN